MSDQELIIVLAASGKQASHLLPHLAANPRFRLRLVVNSQSSLERMSSLYSKTDVVKADLMQPNDCRRILQGSTAIYHVGKSCSIRRFRKVVLIEPIGPPMHAHETQLGYNVIDAALAEAKEGNFKHFVYSSVMNTQLRKLLNHDCKRYVEEYLIESGLNWTILNPTNTLESLPVSQFQKDEKPVFKCIHNPQCNNSLLALRDLGDAAAKIITDREKHYFAKYDCASTMPTSYTEVISRISTVIGKEIQIEWLPYPQGVKARLSGGLGGESATQGVKDIVQRLVIYSNDHSVKGNPNVLRWLLGRDTTSIEDWTKMQLQI